MVKDALLLILAHPPGCNAVKQAEVILLLGLHSACALKGAERTMLIQDNGGWRRHSTRGPSLERCKERHNPTTILLEHALLAQGFMGVQKATFPTLLTTAKP
jgi:hypothetical protein